MEYTHIPDEDLESVLQPVLDWWQRSGCGMGEIKDKLDDMRRRRQVMTAAEDVFGLFWPCSRPGVEIDIEEILRLRTLGFSYRQIARRLGCAVGTVHKYAARAKEWGYAR